MPSNLKEADFEAVQKALNRKTARCPSASYQAVEDGGEGWLCPHEAHAYTSRMPDLAYDGLRAVFTRSSDGASRHSDWEAADNGALEGALLKALPYISFTPAGIARCKILSILRRSDDTRKAALEVVLEWLTKETP